MNLWILSFALLLAFLSGASAMCAVVKWAISVNDWRPHATSAVIGALVSLAAAWLLAIGA